MNNDVFWDIKAQFIPHRRYYVSATEPSRLILYKVSCFQSGDYKECSLLGCDAM
jgi:hypothetical protein